MSKTKILFSNFTPIKNGDLESESWITIDGKNVGTIVRLINWRNEGTYQSRYVYDGVEAYRVEILTVEGADKIFPAHEPNALARARAYAREALLSTNRSGGRRDRRNRSGFGPKEAEAWADARKGTAPFHLWKHAVIMTAAMSEPTAATLAQSGPEWTSRLMLWWDAGDDVRGAAYMLAEFAKGHRLSARAWDSREQLRSAMKHSRRR